LNYFKYLLENNYHISSILDVLLVDVHLDGLQLDLGELCLQIKINLINYNQNINQPTEN
jgi:hypothetical protein